MACAGITVSGTRSLLQGFARDAVVTWHAGKPLPAQDFCGAAATLAARLPRATHALNLCEQGPSFLLASAAAWGAGQTLVLPPDRLARTLQRMGARFAGAYCLCDTRDVAQFAQRQGMRAFEVEFDSGARRDSWPSPELPSSLIAAVLFTSGSTGEPQPHAKTWGELVDGAITFVRSFGQPGPASAILGTVAAQHMFGFETTIMLPLQSGTPLLPQRPTLPADLRGALDAAHEWGRDAIWLMTTPLQLQAFHAAGGAAGPVGLARVVTATMALDARLARAVETGWSARVEEIYGCTEGGMLAHRRPAATASFTAANDIRFAADAQDVWTAKGGHLPAPIPLADRLDLAPAGDDFAPQRFTLLGRDDDIVKIAGKRASLAGLTEKLRAVPGVRDGAVFLATSDARRVSAAVVAPELSEAELRTAFAADIDPAFLPRRFLLLDFLPRGLAGKVSVAALRDMIAGARGENADAAAAGLPRVLTAEQAMPAGHPVLAGHFPGRPIVPGVVLLQWVEALLAEHRLALRECLSVKFHAPLAPAERVTIRIEVAADLTARFGVTRDAVPIAGGACRCAAVPVQP
jgi:acyl-CoA synthetase (AMP-forming)/AMP-acid ligase II